MMGARILTAAVASTRDPTEPVVAVASVQEALAGCPVISSAYGDSGVSLRFEVGAATQWCKCRSSIFLTFTAEKQIRLARAAWGAEEARALPVAGPPHLRRALLALREALLEQHRNELRQDKGRSVRVRAIRSQVDRIAAAMGFQYRLEIRPRQVRVVVVADKAQKARKGSEFKVIVPFDAMEERIGKLPALVELAQGLYARGARWRELRL